MPVQAQPIVSWENCLRRDETMYNCKGEWANVRGMSCPQRGLGPTGGLVAPQVSTSQQWGLTSVCSKIAGLHCCGVVLPCRDAGFGLKSSTVAWRQRERQKPATVNPNQNFTISLRQETTHVAEN